jgi:predicted ATPase
LLDRLPYQVDHARIEDNQIAIRLDQRLEQSYRMLGYDVMRINAMPVEERVKIILQEIEKG